jgi:hypothetical protein
MTISFSKSDKKIIKLSSFFKYLGILIILLGIAGVSVGIHKLYILKTFETRNYDKIFTLLSFGIACFGYLIYDAYRIIGKFKTIQDTKFD